MFAMTIFVIVATSCHKNNGNGGANNNNNNTDSVLKYTIKMQGNHIWKGWRDPPTGPRDSFSFEKPIFYVNDTTITFWPDLIGTTRYHYLSKNDTDKTITFNAYTDYVGGFSEDTLIYDYQNNIIYYNSYSDYKAHVDIYHLHTP